MLLTSSTAPERHWLSLSQGTWPVATWLWRIPGSYILSRHHPWTSFYWDDWATDTAHLSHLEYSIYHRLLTHYYKTQKPLLANATALLRVCQGSATAEQEALSSVLAQFFILEGDGYHNRRADKELKRASSISEQRSLAGKSGGLAKARVLLQQSPTHPHPHIKPPIIPLKNKKPKCETCADERFIHQVANLPGPRLIACPTCGGKNGSVPIDQIRSAETLGTL